jgi:hypothetical protein
MIVWSVHDGLSPLCLPFFITTTDVNAMEVSKEPRFCRVDPEGRSPKNYSLTFLDTLSCLLPSYTVPLGRYKKVKLCVN